jgi:hypothetical protein
MTADGEPGRAPATDGPTGTEINELVLEACVLAAWSDDSMAVAERNHVTHLIRSLTDDSAERERLHRLVLRDLDRAAILARVAALPSEERLEVFDRCARVLAADGRLTGRERRFLSTLRRHTGVPRRLGFQLALRHSRALRWRIVGLALLVPLAAVALVWWWNRPDTETAPPPQASIHPPMQVVVAPGPPVDLSPDALFERVRQSVVTVTVRHDFRPVSSGSGVAIGSAGGTLAFVVTNRHVVADPVPAGARFEVEVRGADEARWDAVLDFISERHDLALLAVPSAAPRLPPLPLEPRSQLRVGQTVFAVGSPIGLRLTFTSGIVSAFRGPWIQTDATVHSGSSGGPLLTAAGHLCGIITQAHEQKDFAFALPADAVVEMLVERDEADTTP